MDFGSGAGVDVAALRPYVSLSSAHRSRAVVAPEEAAADASNSGEDQSSVPAIRCCHGRRGTRRGPGRPAGRSARAMVAMLLNWRRPVEVLAEVLEALQQRPGAATYASPHCTTLRRRNADQTFAMSPSGAGSFISAPSRRT